MVFFYGIILAIIGSSLQALGLSIWKLHTQKELPKKAPQDSFELSIDNPLLQLSPGTPLLISQDESDNPDMGNSKGCQMCRKISGIWICGLLSFSIGNVCDFVALGIAPLSIVTLIGSWSLVVNTFLAKHLINETVQKMDFLSIIFIITGIILTIIGSDHRPNEWPLPRLIKHYEEPKVIFLLIILASIVFSGLLLIHNDFKKRIKTAKDEGSILLRKPERFIRALYVIVGSVVGNFTALFGKAFSGLLIFTFSGEDQFNDPFVVIIVVVFFISLPLQIYLINESLVVNDILYHIPNFYVFWNIGNILTGAIFYEETSHFLTANWIHYSIGILLLFFGVMCTNISSAQKQV